MKKKILSYLLLSTLLCSSGAVLAQEEITTSTGLDTTVASSETSLTDTPTATIDSPTTVSMSTVTSGSESFPSTVETTAVSVEETTTTSTVSSPETRAIQESEETIIGADGRYKISNGNISPYKQIAYIEGYYKGKPVARGTGTLISPNKVLTAGHLVWNIKNKVWIDNFQVYFGVVNNNTLYRTFSGGTFHVFSNYKYGENIEDDLAVITIDSNIGNIEPLSVSESANISQNYKVIGYPGDKVDISLYEGIGKLLQVNTKTLYYHIDTYGGNSGGPVLDLNNRIVGVHVEGLSSSEVKAGFGYNKARKIETEALKLISLSKSNSLTTGNVAKYIPTYRMYNATLKKHLYTVDPNEYNVLSQKGWTKEGVSWRTNTIGKPIYRLYHSGLKVHLYTLSEIEKNQLSTSGWRNEGISWYSSGTRPVYRLYNSSLKVHLYTTDANEYKVLATRGWRQEGVAWNVE